MEIQFEVLNEKNEWTKSSAIFNVEHDFKIDPDSLDTTLCELPSLMISYGQLHSQLKSELSRKAEHVKFIASKKAQEIRHNGEKNTEGSIKEQVLISPEYQAAVKDQNTVERNAILAESWWRSINKKADLVQSLVYRESSEIKRGAY